MPEMHLEYSVQVRTSLKALLMKERRQPGGNEDILIETAENILPKEKKRKRQSG